MEDKENQWQKMYLCVCAKQHQNCVSKVKFRRAWLIFTN